MVKGGQIDMITMIENMVTFTGAGYGINASALLWAVYELCIDRLGRGYTRVYPGGGGGSGGYPTHEDLVG